MKIILIILLFIFSSFSNYGTYVVAWCDYDHVWLFRSNRDYNKFKSNKQPVKMFKIKNSDHELYFADDLMIELYPG